jgi:hypothetical protein
MPATGYEVQAADQTNRPAWLSVQATSHGRDHAATRAMADAGLPHSWAKGPDRLQHHALRAAGDRAEKFWVLVVERGQERSAPRPRASGLIYALGVLVSFLALGGCHHQRVRRKPPDFHKDGLGHAVRQSDFSSCAWPRS